LLTTFGGLALLSLLTAGATMWAIFEWRAGDEQLQGHYQRSLLLQRVRATTFRAFKEVPDAVTGGDTDARQQFEALLKPADEDFEQWAALADTEDERGQVERVRAAYTAIVLDARSVFDLVDAGRNEEAFALMEGRLEDQQFLSFEDRTADAVASDRDTRARVRAVTQNTRQTAQLILAGAAFGTLSLILLLAAYLASDLFKPLREVETALDAVARGDLQQRLGVDRADELGAIGRSFNRMVAAIAARDQVTGMASAMVDPPNEPGDDAGISRLPSRVALHRMVAQLRSRVTRLNGVDAAHAETGEDQRALIGQLDQLLQAVTRVTEFGFPLDLNIARTDIRAMLYEVLLRFHHELETRAVSFELVVAPEVNEALVDRLKLREAFGELVRNALAAMPEQGGKLGIRASLASDGTELLIEVADNGHGSEQPQIDQAIDGRPERDQRLRVGLALTRAIIEQHGGRLTIASEPGQGAFVQVHLPARI